jgi:hypothetical protein
MALPRFRVAKWIGVAQKIAFPTQNPAKIQFTLEIGKYLSSPIFARIFMPFLLTLRHKTVL